MEKYSQYRDKGKSSTAQHSTAPLQPGSGIAPFLPVPVEPAGVYLPLYIFLFAVRIPILLCVSASYFLLFSWLPIGALGRKAALWLIMAVPGLWWVDIRIDGVKRGSLARQKATQTPIPGPGSIIAASLTSPIDALYLAAIFDPVFTISYPTTRLVQPTSLLSAILRALAAPLSAPRPLRSRSDSSSSSALSSTGSSPALVSLAALRAAHPDRPIVVFPECSTTNGRAILPPGPSLLSAPADARIFPTSLRYTPADVTTPLPGPAAALAFLWVLCSRPTHTIRVRIAEPVFNVPGGGGGGGGGTDGGETGEEDSWPRRDGSSPAMAAPNSYATNFLDSLQTTTKGQAAMQAQGEDADVTEEEQRVLDRVAEALARLGRVKRVGLGLKEKSEFVGLWNKKRR